MSMKKNFTLIEIMVAIAIVALLATLTITNVLRTRINSNETLAISNLRTIYAAVQQYYMSNNSYPDSLIQLATPNANPGYIDAVLASGSRAGYDFEYIPDNAEEAFSVTASPKNVGKTGVRYFYVDEKGVIRQNTGGAASADSDPVK